MNSLEARLEEYGRKPGYGMSSRCMANVALGLKADGNYPHDPDDLNRCLQLIKAVPEVREAFPRIAELHESWKVLIENWDALESSFLEEAGDNWCKSKAAHRTYQMMKDLLKPTRGVVQQISEGGFLINLPDDFLSRMKTRRRGR